MTAVWIKVSLGCFFLIYFYGCFIGLDLILNTFWILVGFYWTDHWPDHSPTANKLFTGGLKLCCTEGGVKGFWDHPPNATGKSSFHRLISNVTFLCIIVDLREDICSNWLGTAMGPLKGLHSTGSHHCEHAAEFKNEHLITRTRTVRMQLCLITFKTNKTSQYDTWCKQRANQ